jgi:hypothetical protein
VPKSNKVAKAAIAGGAIALMTGAARKRGYRLGWNTIVRCRKGYLFTTIWIPGASVKSLRLGRSRFQRCPVGKHWTLVKPIKDADLTDEDRATAAQTRDARIP